MSTATNTPATESKSSEVSKITLGDFGNGRFSQAMSELFHDSQRLLSFTEEQAHVTARQLGVDAGPLLKQSVSLKYGKSVSKDGKMSLKEVTESGKLNATWSMHVGSVCAQLDAARKVGLVINDCTMSPNIMAFIDAQVEKLKA